MFQGLQDNQLKGAIEAMLFVTDEPVGTISLADMLEVEPGQAERALVELRDQLEGENRGIQLREVAGGWRLYTHPAYHELIERYVLSWDTRKLSQAAMETLAIVAYLQPVTRSGVASVRGVNSDSSINSLVEKGLVREAVQGLQGFHALIPAAVIHNRHGKSLFLCLKKCLPDLQHVVAWCHKIDIVCILCLQLQKNVRKPPDRNHFSALHLRNMMVLTVNTPQITSGKENRPRPRRPGNTRLLPEMQCSPRRRNPGGRLTISRLSMLPVRSALPRTNPAPAHLLFQIQHNISPFSL